MIIGIIGRGNKKAVIDHLIDRHEFVLIRLDHLLAFGTPRTNCGLVVELSSEEDATHIKKFEGKMWACLKPEKLYQEKVVDWADEVQVDAILPDHGDEHHLRLLVDAIMASYSGRMSSYNPNQDDDDVPPFLRKKCRGFEAS